MKKKLMLKKEVVVLLSENEMRQQKGGESLPGEVCFIRKHPITEYWEECKGTQECPETFGLLCYTITCDPNFSKEMAHGCPGTLGC